MEFKDTECSQTRKRWDEDEDFQLYDETHSGLDIVDIARIHGRTESAVRSRQHRLGLREEWFGPLINPLPDYQEVSRANERQSKPVPPRHEGTVSLEERGSMFDGYIALLPGKSADDVVLSLWQALKSDIAEMCAGLAPEINPDRYAVVLEKRLAPGVDHEQSCTLQELGDRFGVTKERIRQLEVKALWRLKHPSRFLRSAFKEQMHAFLNDLDAADYRQRGAWLIGVLSHRPCDPKFRDFVVKAFLRETAFPEEKRAKFKQALNDAVRRRSRSRS